VRIKAGFAGVFSLSDRPFTHGHAIYTKGRPLTTELLLHELTHVWQFEHAGADYMTRSLVAQTRGDAYDWSKAVAEGKSWSELNPEQQAQLVQSAYAHGFFDGPNKQLVIGGSDYSAYARSALAQLRAGEGA
jgi:hypothetical protein